ncbi:MAG: caspase family protein [Saprospiraceae bacterium]
MRKLLLLWLAFPIFLAAQTEKTAVTGAAAGKGATPLPTQNSKPKTQNSTRAVVVGISDYQDTHIPDLKYAHRDAEAFAAWLHSPAGGSLPEDNVQLLINEKATLGQFVASLDWLVEKSLEGDQVIIYFSGHGDVDTKLFGQPGFLLLWNTAPESYMN